MFCRVDSEHFKDFLTLVSSQFGIDVANKINHPKCTGDLIHYVSVADPFDNLGGAAYSSIPSHLAEFKGLADWSIYNNTKLLSELSDEQAAELFNHKRHGGVVQAKSEIGWLDSSLWNNSWVYRAKQRSECALFIEAVSKVLGDGCDDEAAIALFNAGFKAPIKQ